MNLYVLLASGSPSGSAQAYAFLRVLAGASPSLVSIREPDHDLAEVSVECDRIGPPATGLSFRQDRPGLPTMAARPQVRPGEPRRRTQACAKTGTGSSVAGGTAAAEAAGGPAVAMRPE